MKTPRDDVDHWPDPAGANTSRSVLAADLFVEGRVSSRGPVDLQGSLVGSLWAPDVVVASSARLEGTVVARELLVLGTVSGKVLAQTVQLAPNAVVQADVIHEQISIEAGAALDGRLQRKT